ncbi:MAG: NB-ARC domain-containing protein, partial [Candidatus Dormibacteraeota bacterium]|nr:NB-ARC domain-containing protein [Candidatus Dormibacteraeota bacterium]
MEYRILGPVEARCDSRVLPLGGPKVRTLLAVLLLHANQVVPAERLVDDLWGDGSPISARNLVQGYVSHLRATLVSGAFGEPLTTLPGGYLLRVAREEFDLFRFEDLVQSAEAAMGEDDVAAAAEDLRAALALWRGPALAGVSSRTLLERARPRLEEQRLSALEERIAADLRLGRHQRLVGELRELIASEPLRERLRGQLMTALYGSDRRAEALQEYRAAREMLASELGVEPSSELQRLEHAIRGSDASLLGPRFALPVPRQLPPDIPDFTGSSRSLEVAERLLASGESGAAVMATVVISGPAGIGKTTVAVHVAHQLLARFPDGQLFADLGGAEIQAADSGNVLARFLRALGVHGSAIPADLAERTALYRARLADRRVLVVLDNVASEVQVRPLLPGGAGCAVLITSRRPLGALQGAAALPLTVLDAGQAFQLLANIAGRERIAKEPEAAQVIVELTGGLPLAVRISGARLASRPKWRVTKLAQRLQDERGRLDELKLGDLEVRASLALSYQGLDERSRRAFGLLGVMDGADFPVWLAAGALGAGIAEVEITVESLVDAGLLEEAGEDRAGQPRYRFHSLVRAFARECLLSTEPAGGRKAA